MRGRNQQYVPVVEAIARAAAAGLTVRLLSGVEPHAHALSIGIATTDPDPLVSLRCPGGIASGEQLLDQREASGPDRWDYPAAVPCSTPRLLLRLSRADATADVPVAPAGVAILREHGWRDERSLLAEAVVRSEDLAAALAALAPEGVR